MLHAYGGSILGDGRLAYSDWFSLWLNLGRQRRARTWEVMKALEFANSATLIPEGYFDAVTCCEEESINLEYNTNKARAYADIFK